MKKITKQLISLLAGGIIGYLLYYHFFMEVLVLFFTSGFLYMAVSALFLLLSIVGCHHLPASGKTGQ